MVATGDGESGFSSREEAWEKAARSNLRQEAAKETTLFKLGKVVTRTNDTGSKILWIINPCYTFKFWL